VTAEGFMSFFQYASTPPLHHSSTQSPGVRELLSTVIIGSGLVLFLGGFLCIRI
jgi:hypothetical protein